VFTEKTSLNWGIFVPGFGLNETPVPPKLYLNPSVELKPFVKLLTDNLAVFCLDRSVLLEKRSWFPTTGLVLAIYFS